MNGQNVALISRRPHQYTPLNAYDPNRVHPPAAYNLHVRYFSCYKIDTFRLPSGACGA